LRWTWRHYAVDIHTDFDSVPDSSDYTGRVGSGACIPKIGKIKLAINFAFIKNVAARNIEDGFLRESGCGKRDL